MEKTVSNQSKGNRAASNPEKWRRAEKHFRIKVIINAVLVILGSVFIAFFLLQMRGHLILEKQRDSCKSAFENAILLLRQLYITEICLPKTPAAALSSVADATASPPSSALHLTFYPAPLIGTI